MLLISIALLMPQLIRDAVEATVLDCRPDYHHNHPVAFPGR